MENIIYDCKDLPLGDEMFLIRSVIIDMLAQKLISNKIIIYTKKDRAFLYSKIFGNIIYKESVNTDKVVEYCNDTLNKNYIYTTPWTFVRGVWSHGIPYDTMISSNLLISIDNILNYKRINYYNKYENPDFLNLVGEIDYYNHLPIFTHNKYIAVHFRRKKTDLDWNTRYKDLDIIINNINYPIVIFSGDIEEIKEKYNNPKLYLTNNLQEYMSLLKHANCFGIISPWSGGGQIASYCMNPNLKIIMYFSPSQCTYKCTQEELNNYIESPNGFDFIDFNNKNRYFIDYPVLENEYDKFIISIKEIFKI